MLPLGLGPELDGLFSLALLGGATFLIWRAARGRTAMSKARPDAEEAVRERYARGEIDRAEFLRVLSDLQGRPFEKGS